MSTVIDFGDPKIDAMEIISHFQNISKLPAPDWTFKERADGEYLVINIAKPNEKYFRALNQALKLVSEGNRFLERTTILEREIAPPDRLLLPETKYLRTIISESLTVTQHSFGDDFFSRYINSVFGAEDQIKSNANHIVFGRRGSGKSSLLAFLMHTIREQHRPFVWISMQTYAARDDFKVIVAVLIELVNQLLNFASNKKPIEVVAAQLKQLHNKTEEVEVKEIDQLIPSIRFLISPIALQNGPLVVFLDDVHLISEQLQSMLLGKLYGLARGNQTFLKISAIEQFSKIWDSGSRVGLQVPHDAQVIRLDLNLTNPKKSLVHISNILDAHARYAGLPSIGYISGDDVLTRLLWVAAGVPRDALDIYGQAIARALVKDQRKVSVTSINEASSQNAQEKLREIDGLPEHRLLFDRIKAFCTLEQHTNAFLVEIKNNTPELDVIRDLVAYRLLHLIDEGFTPSEAGRRHIALMLDYGFYIGIRAAKSVRVFQKEPTQPQAKELRKLPIFLAPVSRRTA